MTNGKATLFIQVNFQPQTTQSARTTKLKATDIKKKHIQQNQNQ